MKRVNCRHSVPIHTPPCTDGRMSECRISTTTKVNRPAFAWCGLCRDRLPIDGVESIEWDDGLPPLDAPKAAHDPVTDPCCDSPKRDAAE